MSATRVEATASSRFRRRILIPIVLLIVLRSLDRVNTSFAALQLNAEISIALHELGQALIAQ